MNFTNFETYLEENVAPSTAKRYLRAVELFFHYCQMQSAITEKNIQPRTATYSQIMAYLGALRSKTTLKKSTLNGNLNAIKHYYQNLINTNQRNDHPCKNIQLRGKSTQDIQLQDLFSREELAKLLQQNTPIKQYENRNKLIISLLIYQGLSRADFKQLNCQDLDLAQGTIYLKPTTKTNARTLKLEAQQVFWMMNYLQHDREKLIAKNKKVDFLEKQESALLITSRGTPEKGEGVQYLIEGLKNHYPNRELNLRSIRQSVITNLLKEGKELRIVQVFAGHKYPSTTEKYKQTQVEELKNQILKYHPLQ